MYEVNTNAGSQATGKEQQTIHGNDTEENNQKPRPQKGRHAAHLHREQQDSNREAGDEAYMTVAEIKYRFARDCKYLTITDTESSRLYVACKRYMMDLHGCPEMCQAYEEYKPVTLLDYGITGFSIGFLAGALKNILSGEYNPLPYMFFTAALVSYVFAKVLSITGRRKLASDKYYMIPDYSKMLTKLNSYMESLTIKHGSLKKIPKNKLLELYFMYRVAYIKSSGYSRVMAGKILEHIRNVLQE